MPKLVHLLTRCFAFRVVIVLLKDFHFSDCIHKIRLPASLFQIICTCFLHLFFTGLRTLNVDISKVIRKDINKYERFLFYFFACNFFWIYTTASFTVGSLHKSLSGTSILNSFSYPIIISTSSKESAPRSCSNLARSVIFEGSTVITPIIIDLTFLKIAAKEVSAGKMNAVF